MKIKKSKKMRKYLGPVRKLYKIVEHDDDGDTNCN